MKKIVSIILVIFLMTMSIPNISLYAESYVDEMLNEITEDDEFPIRYYNQIKAAIQSGKYTEEEIWTIVCFIEMACDYTDKDIFWDDGSSGDVSKWTISEWKAYMTMAHGVEDFYEDAELLYDYYWNFAVNQAYYASQPTSYTVNPTATPKPTSVHQKDDDRAKSLINKLGSAEWKDLLDDKDVLEWAIEDWYDYLEDYFKKDDIDILYDYYYSLKPNYNGTLTNDYVILYSGEEEYISIRGNRENVKWKSDNKKIATVQDGLITALKSGTTTITAKVGSKTLKCTVEVKKSQLKENSLTVQAGEIIKIEIDGSNGVPSYTSSNTSAVDVVNGKLMAIAPGKATVTVKVGNEKLKCKIKVLKMDAPKGLSFSSDTNKIRLEWNAVSGAYSYSIYMYDKASKEYILCGNTKKTHFDVKKLDSNTKYVFRVAANININGVLTEQKMSEKIECSTIENINGWITDNNKTYYYKKGYSIGQGLMEIKGKLYIFDNNGALVKDKFSNLDGKRYYSNANGTVVCNKDVTDQETCIVYVADSKGVLTAKPFVPILKDTNEYKVVNSYKYASSSGSYTYLVYIVEAKKNTDIELKLTIKNKNGDVYDTCSDSISLTKGKKNVFILQTSSNYVDSSYKYSFSSRSYNSIWTGDIDAANVTHYNKNGKRLYITIKQTKEKLGSFAALKVLLYNNGSLVFADDLYYDVYATGLQHKGDEDVMDINIYGVSFDTAEFYYEDR